MTIFRRGITPSLRGDEELKDSIFDDRDREEILQPFLLALHVTPLLLLSGPSSSGRNRVSWMNMFAVCSFHLCIQAQPADRYSRAALHWIREHWQARRHCQDGAGDLASCDPDLCWCASRGHAGGHQCLLGIVTRGII